VNGSSSPPVEQRGAASEKRRTEAILERFHEEATFDKGHDVRLLIKLWPYLHKHQAWLWVATLVIVVTAGTSLLTPLIMRDAIDEGVVKKNPSQLMKGGLLFAGVVVVEQLLTFIQIYALQVVGARAMADLRLKLFSFLHELKIGFFDSQPVGRLVTRVTNDVDAILELFASGALNAFGDLIRLVGIVALMLALDYRLSLIAFAAIPPVAMVVWLVRRSFQCGEDRADEEPGSQLARDQIGVLTLPAKARGFGQRLLHHRRGVDEDLHLAAEAMHQLLRQPLQPPLEHVVVVAVAGVDREIAHRRPRQIGQRIAGLAVALGDDDGATRRRIALYCRVNVCLEIRQYRHTCPRIKSEGYLRSNDRPGVRRAGNTLRTDTAQLAQTHGNLQNSGKYTTLEKVAQAA